MKTNIMDTTVAHEQRPFKNRPKAPRNLEEYCNWDKEKYWLNKYNVKEMKTEITKKGKDGSMKGKFVKKSQKSLKQVNIFKELGIRVI